MTATPMPFGLEQTGGPNEPWSFGPEACEHITAALFLRDGAHLPITG